MTTDEYHLLVVTPTLGASAWLDATVASVAAQPVNLTHVLVVPPDEQRTLRARFPQTLVVCDAGKTGGIYGALNAVLHEPSAGWRWFTYINDDDTLLPGFADVFFRHLRRTTPEPVVYGDVDLMDEGGMVLSRITTERNPAWIPALLHQGISPLMQQGMLFRHDVVQQLGGFDQRYELCADLDFWLRAYTAGWHFRHYPRRVAQFRLRAGQLSARTTTTEREQAAIVRRHLPDPVPGLRKFYARWRYRAYNLPRYLARVRRCGFQSSYELLQQGGAPR